MKKKDLGNILIVALIFFNVLFWLVFPPPNDGREHLYQPVDRRNVQLERAPADVGEHFPVDPGALPRAVFRRARPDVPIP